LDRDKIVWNVFIAPCLTDALLQEEQFMELLSSYLIGADCYSEIIETTAEFNM